MNKIHVGISQLLVFALLYDGSFRYTSNAETYSGNATWYSLGSTACGDTYTDSDMVVAVCTLFWNNTVDPNPNHDHICTKSIRVRDAQNSSSASVVVKVVDKCGGCDEGDLDLSPAAFELFHNRDVGIFPILWEFTDTTNKTGEIDADSDELDYYSAVEVPVNENILDNLKER